MDTSLLWKIVFGQRRFTSGHRTVGGEEEDHNNHGGTQVTDFMKSRNMEEDMVDIFGIWEWMDGSWLYRSYIYK